MKDETRHRAVDESKSLSAWIADPVAAELRNSATGNESLLQALGDADLADCELDIPDRRSAQHRDIEFPNYVKRAVQTLP